MSVTINDSVIVNMFPCLSNTLLHCPECGFLAEYYDSPHAHKWSKRLVCKCSRDWLVCTVCTRQRKHFVDSRQIARHAIKCRSKVITKAHSLVGSSSNGGNKRSANTLAEGMDFGADDDSSICLPTSAEVNITGDVQLDLIQIQCLTICFQFSFLLI
jgi:hypothetical protein